MGRLDGKTAIITGGASGIGEGTVRLFQAERAPALAANVRDEPGKRLAEALGEGVYRKYEPMTLPGDGRGQTR